MRYAFPRMTTIGLKRSAPSVEALQRRAESLGVELQESLVRVLSQLPCGKSGPSAIAEELRLSRVIISRLVNALECRDALEVLHRVPGPESIRGFLNAALGRGGSEDAVARARAAVESFEALIREVFGTRSALDAFLSANSDSARDRFEMAGRQAVFKGMSELLGARAETWLCSLVITPGEGGVDRPDILAIHGALGVRQLRPDATVCFGYLGPAQKPTSAPAQSARRLAMGKVSLEPYFAHPPAPLEIVEVGGVPAWVMRHASPGRKSLVDMLRVDHARSASPGTGSDTPRQPPDRTKPVRSLWALTDLPSIKLIFDVVLAPDLARRVVPTHRVYDTSIRGIASPDDPSRLIDVRTASEAVEPLGDRPDCLDCEEIPRYSEMLQHACAECGIDPTGYSAFRLRVQYPVYGWQFCMLFEERDG